MMNCIPRRKLIQPQARPGEAHRSNGGSEWRRVMLGTFLAIIALTLLWVQPVAAQEEAVGPVYALPGTLSITYNRSYATILTTADGTQYGLVGQTSEIEEQIVDLRAQESDVEVTVWGDRYAAANEEELEVIVVSSIQPSEPAEPSPEAATTTPLPTSLATPAPTATLTATTQVTTNIPAVTSGATATPTPTPTSAPTSTPTSTPTDVPTPAVPVAVVTAATVNVRSGPGTDYPRVGSVTAGDACAITGRNEDSTWWQLSCAGGPSGWVFGELLALNGPIADVQVVSTAPPPTPVPTETFAYWRTSFFPNMELSGPPVLTLDSPTIDFNWGEGSPGAGVPAERFSARFERTLEFNYGTYEIALTMDDGARLYIDDQLVINEWELGASRTRTVRQVLSGARRFRVEYFEGSGFARVHLAINFVSSSEAWRASYFANQDLAGNPVLTRGEPRSGSAQLDYNWGRAAPASGVPEDTWSARWVGTFGFSGGDYRFVSDVDDGIRVYIDGILILDRWQNGYHTGVTNTFRNLGAGNHQIVVEYYEAHGDALVRLWWERIGDAPEPEPNGGRPRVE